MGCCDILKEEFHFKNFKHDHNQPEQFVRCRWQKKDGISIPYLVYRWLVAAFYLATMYPCFSEIDYEERSLARTLKWPIFVTYWSYFMNFIQAAVASYLITRALVSERRGQEQKCGMCAVVKIYWILHNIAVVFAIGVGSGYWLAIHDYAHDKLYVTGFIVHGVNAVLMVTDLFLASHPIRLLHFYCPVTFAFIYLIFSLIYFATNGKNRDDEDYIYKKLNWNKPLEASMFCLLCVIGLLLLQVLVWLLFLLRQWLFVVWIKKKGTGDADADAVDQV